MHTIEKVAIVGGTHGNELTGIHLVRNLLNGKLRLPHSFDFNFMLANPEAIATNQRFMEADLNRQFALGNLKHAANLLYELNLAQMLNRKLGPKHQPMTDLVIDVHNTTSNMGPTLIVLESSLFYREMAGYLKARMPQVNILVEDEVSYNEHPYLCTLGRFGVMLELGAQPQGVARADIYADCVTMLTHILDYVELNNTHQIRSAAGFEAYRLLDVVHFPYDQDEQLLGHVHPNLQDNDFAPLAPGDPMFQLFSGGTMPYNGDSVVYPHFINEAAYHHAQVAFSTAEKFIW